MGREYIKEGAQHTALRDACAQGEGGRCVLPCSDILGAVDKEIQDPVTDGWSNPQCIELADQLFHVTVLKADIQHLGISVTFFQMDVWRASQMASSVDLFAL